ncbi:MAG: DNA mismatch repair protein MutT, partial [Lachnospiraceae bacterium]|nr:DNA mismatch repair protein MutT [Lachnospiraceae bacterium]
IDPSLRGIVTFISGKGMTEYMFLYTAERFSGDLTECNEGDLMWIPKAKIKDLTLWEGDKIFLKLLYEDAPFFSLKLVYDENDILTDAFLDGERTAVSRSVQRP